MKMRAMFYGLQTNVLLLNRILVVITNMLEYMINSHTHSIVAKLGQAKEKSPFVHSLLLLLQPFFLCAIALLGMGCFTIID